jgi:hypothetical protein
MLVSITGMERPTDELDLDAALECLASRRLVTTMPYLRVTGFHRGLLLLCDRSPGMLLFEEDQAHLQAMLRRLIGESLLEVQSFRYFPVARGGGLFAPPDPPRPVLIVTSLGIDEAGDEWVEPRRWLELVRMLRQRGCKVVLLVPYPKHRWPTRLQSELPLVAWDRATTVITVKRMLERFGGRS